MPRCFTSEAEAACSVHWLLDKGMQFRFGPDPETDLTEDQVLDSARCILRRYALPTSLAAPTVGIQYQQGLKDLVPASDLAEGLLNNVDRPPGLRPGHGKPLFPGQALPHFNEVDECVGLDAPITNRVWTALGLSARDHAP